MKLSLEILTSREQLMEDIDCIVEGFFCDTWGDDYSAEKEQLVAMICDAVVANFPAK